MSCPILFSSCSLLKGWEYLAGTSKTLQLSFCNILSLRTSNYKGEKKRHTFLNGDISLFIFQTSTKAPKPVRQPSLDLPTTSMMVASTKSLWETGEVAAQSAVKSSPCKVWIFFSDGNRISWWGECVYLVQGLGRSSSC